MILVVDYKQWKQTAVMYITDQQMCNPLLILTMEEWLFTRTRVVCRVYYVLATVLAWQEFAVGDAKDVL